MKASNLEREDSATPVQKPDVLVIDDDPVQLEEMRELIATFGYRSQGTTNGEKGLEILRQSEQFGIAVIDLYMPGTHGIDVLKKLRTDPDIDRRIQCILITAHPLVDDAIEGLDLGATTVLVKPLSVDKFRTQLADAVERYSTADFSDRPSQTGFRKQVQALMEVTHRMAKTGDPAMEAAADTPAALGQWAHQLPLHRTAGHSATYRSDTPEELYYFLRVADQVSILQTALGHLSLSVKALRVLSSVVRAHIEGWQMPISALGLATDLPQTTAFRYFEELHKAGLVERRTDPNDKRRMYGVLTQDGMDRLKDAMSGLLSLEKPQSAQQKQRA